MICTRTQIVQDFGMLLTVAFLARDVRDMVPFARLHRIEIAFISTLALGIHITQ